MSESKSAIKESAVNRVRFGLGNFMPSLSKLSWSKQSTEQSETNDSPDIPSEAPAVDVEAGEAAPEVSVPDDSMNDAPAASPEASPSLGDSLVSRAAGLLPEMLRSMRSAPTPSTASPPNPHEEAMIALLEAAREVTRLNSEGYLQKMKHDNEVLMGKQEVQEKKIAELTEQVKRLDREARASETARAAAALEVQRLTRQARSVSDAQGAGTPTLLPALFDVLQDAKIYLAVLRAEASVGGAASLAVSREPPKDGPTTLAGLHKSLKGMRRRLLHVLWEVEQVEETIDMRIQAAVCKDPTPAARRRGWSSESEITLDATMTQRHRSASDKLYAPDPLATMTSKAFPLRYERASTPADDSDGESIATMESLEESSMAVRWAHLCDVARQNAVARAESRSSMLRLQVTSTGDEEADARTVADSLISYAIHAAAEDMLSARVEVLGLAELPPGISLFGATTRDVKVESNVEEVLSRTMKSLETSTITADAGAYAASAASALMALPSLSSSYVGSWWSGKKKVEGDSLLPTTQPVPEVEGEDKAATKTGAEAEASDSAAELSDGVVADKISPRSASGESVNDAASCHDTESEASATAEVDEPAQDKPVATVTIRLERRPTGVEEGASESKGSGEGGDQQQESSSTTRASAAAISEDIVASAATARQPTQLNLPSTGNKRFPLYSTPKHRSGSRGVRVLVLDGGGIRGLMMIEMLKRIESLTGRRIHEMFDLICGTSSGGFLALLVGVKKMSLEHATSAYEIIRTMIGGQNAIMGEMKRFTIGASHDSATADKLFQGLFGEETLTECSSTPLVFVTAAAVDGYPAQMYLFRNYELRDDAFRKAEFLGTSKCKIAEAARATTAAPTFYDPAVIGGQKFVDGAILANNPVLVALSEVAVLWPGRPLDCVVSLGCGEPKTRPNNPTGVMNWVKHVVDLAMSSAMDHKLAAGILGDRYFRFDADSGEGDVLLTESRKSVLDGMLKTCKGYITRNDKEFRRLAKLLTRKRIRKEWTKQFDKLPKAPNSPAPVFTAVASDDAQAEHAEASDEAAAPAGAGSGAGAGADEE